MVFVHVIIELLGYRSIKMTLTLNIDVEKYLQIQETKKILLCDWVVVSKTELSELLSQYSLFVR